MNAETAGHAGTPQLKQFLMVNIDMWKHPKYYKELKEFGKRGDRGKPTAASPDTDQVISKEPATAGNQRAPGPGLKPQAPSDKHQAASDKRQASSSKLVE